MPYSTKWWCCIYLLCCCHCICLKAGMLPLVLFQKVPTSSSSSSNNSSGSISSAIAHRFAGYIDYQPNGTITLRSDSLENATNWQNLLLFKTILKAIKLAAPFTSIEATKDAQAPKINIKIYGEGIEHKFPPFLERIIQRIQTYFSVYRYTDTIRRPSPQQPDLSTTSTVITYGNSGDAYNENFLTTTVVNNADVEHTAYIDYSTDYPGTTTLSNSASELDATNDDYSEFITMGEGNEGFIIVGED